MTQWQPDERPDIQEGESTGTTHVHGDQYAATDVHDSVVAVGPGAQVVISPAVEENLGRVIGVQAQSIQGDVFGGDIYQVQVYALTEDSRAASWHRFLERDTPPYKFLAPYTAQDHALFKGRNREVEQVLRGIGTQPVLVIFGPPASGKTSLLAAGVIPALVQNGALVVQVQDYTQPTDAIRAGLAANADQVPLALPDAATVPVIAQATCEATQGSLVLVLDQFERLFEPAIDPQQRGSFIEGLAQALHTVGPDYLRIVLVAREEALPRLSELADALPDLLRSAIPVLPLTPEQTRVCIEEPLAELNYPISFVGELVSAQLVPDLDALTPDAPGRIEPQHLQIICHWLYGQARQRHPPHVDGQLYAMQGRGADGIIARYLEDALRLELADQEGVARQILARLAAPDAGQWLGPDEAAPDGCSLLLVSDILERLVRAGLLARWTSGDERRYGFTSAISAQAARDLAGPEVVRRYRAADELQRVWSAWLARDVLANGDQLRYLSAHAGHLVRPGQDLPPEKLLLLLRSAVAQDEPPCPWLDMLRTDAGRGLLQSLEWPSSDGMGPVSQLSRTAKAVALLGLDGEALPEAPTGEVRPFGPIAWSAVRSPDPAVRQAAALVLTVPDRHQALDRLDWALQTGLNGWDRRWRRAELRGALVDADPRMGELGGDQGPVEQGMAWLWRFGRHLRRDRQRLAWWTLGAAVAAGLGLGLLRAGLSLPTSRLVGVQFALYFWWAAILAAAVALGLALVDPLRATLRPRDAQDPKAGWNASVPMGVLIGTLFFWLGHGLVTAFNSPSPLNSIFDPLRALGVLFAGLGLSSAVIGLLPVYAPNASGPRLFARRLLSLILAAATFALAEGLAMTLNRSPLLVVGWSESFYWAEYRDLMSAVVSQTLDPRPAWPTALVLVDAALVGAVLAATIAAGLGWADTRWSLRRPMPTPSPVP